MLAVKIKICGITNLDDAAVAADAGAHYLGFIFWPKSQRAVTATAARDIARALRARPACPTLVGVFVDESAEHMASVLDRCGLDLAQLSGDEPPALIGDPQSPLYGRSFKVLHPTSLAEALADAEWYAPPNEHGDHPSLLLDAFHPKLPGGSGLHADWQIAARVAQVVPRMMLAGGLTPQNVRQAIEEVQPFAVDVASGVESGPGRKDHGLVKEFISAVRAACQ